MNAKLLAELEVLGDNGFNRNVAVINDGGITWIYFTRYERALGSFYLTNAEAMKMGGALMASAMINYVMKKKPTP